MRGLFQKIRNGAAIAGAPVGNHEVKKHRVEQTADQIPEIHPAPIAKQFCDADGSGHDSSGQQSEVARNEFHSQKDEDDEADREKNRADDGRKTL